MPNPETDTLDDVASWFLKRVERMSYILAERGLDGTSMTVLVHPDMMLQIQHAAASHSVREYSLRLSPRSDDFHKVDTAFARIRLEPKYWIPRRKLRLKIEPERVRIIENTQITGPHPPPMDRGFTVREPRLQSPHAFL